MHYRFGALIFGGAYFRNFTVYDERSFLNRRSTTVPNQWVGNKGSAPRFKIWWMVLMWRFFSHHLEIPYLIYQAFVRCADVSEPCIFRHVKCMRYLVRHVKCMPYLICHIKCMRHLILHVKCMHYLIHHVKYMHYLICHVKCMRYLFRHVKCMRYFISPCKMYAYLISPCKMHGYVYLIWPCKMHALF